MSNKSENLHHILHYKDYWNANKDNAKLRRSVGMIALLDLDVHNALHKDLPGVPPLDIYIARAANHLYKRHTNPLQAVDNVRFAIDQAIRHPRAHDIEIQSGLITIEAITLQLPYLRDGLISYNE